MKTALLDYSPGSHQFSSRIKMRFLGDQMRIDLIICSFIHPENEALFLAKTGRLPGLHSWIIVWILKGAFKFRHPPNRYIK